MSRVEIEIKWGLISSLHTTGDRVGLVADKLVYLNFQKRPALPATSMKGFLRSQAEALLKTLGKKVCLGPGPKGLCRDEENACLICRIFGSPHIKSPLRFYDTSISQATLNYRTGTAINRKRRTVEEERLFTLETAEGKDLITEIKGLFTNQDKAKDAIAVLFLASKGGFSLGGGRSRGLGWIKYKDYKARLDGKEVSLEEVMEWLNKIL